MTLAPPVERVVARSETVLGLRGLVREFPGTPPVRALAGIDLAVRQGEHVAVTGRSGSGKSTLLNVIGLLETHTAGQYEIHGQDVNGLPSRSRDALRCHTFGFVFQAFHLLDYLTAAENVELGLTYVGGRRSERRARVAEMLERVQMSHRARAVPATLSGGERQRVAIARALVHQPSVLLADEPTGNLDEVTSAAILDLFEQVNAGGTTVVVVTHDEVTAARADRRVVVRDGLVVADEAQAAARAGHA